jgi:hypothetical protein
MSKDWRIIVSGDWFYGTKKECERERAEFESTFTDEDREEHDPVVPERIYSEAPVSVSEVKRYRFKDAAGEYVYSVDFDKAQAEIKRLKLVEEAWKLQKDLPAAMIEALEEIERLKAVTNFKEAVACVFDNLKMVAANTSSKVWDDQLEELAEEVIEFAPEYKKQWKDICDLERKNRELTAALNQALFKF